MICIYQQNCTDFSNNGLGVLTPQSCTVTETLNGEWELTLVHPIDDGGKWQRLVEGRILRVPVPSAMTPRVNIIAQTATEIYKTNADGCPIRVSASDSAKILAKYKKNKQVALIEKTSSTWYKVIGPDGKQGYMQKSELTFVKTKYSLAEATGEVVEAAQLRDQPFRIYRIVPELTQITVYARHIFYDLLDNMIKSYKPSSSATGASVVQGIASHCLSAHDFTFYSDMDEGVIVDPSGDEDKEIAFENVNPVDAFLGTDGFVERYGGELARDWFDVFFMKRVGTDTGAQIRQGKNLLGVSYDVVTTDVVTRIMPTGEDKDGELLYLPEVYIDSENIDAYPQPKWYHLAVSDCRENTQATEDNPKKSKAQCYAQMRQAAQAEFDKGCDLPKVTLSVDFINCAETEEYKEYAFLQNIYLGDTVKVIAPRIGVSVAMRMTQYTYDCLTRKYTDMTLGTAADTLEASTISAKQIPSGSITGSKLAINSVGIGQLQSASVGSLQVQTAAIQTAHIEDAAVTHAKIGDAAIGTAQIEDAAVTNAKIGTAAIGTANIADAAVTNAKIANAAVGTANIEDAAIVSAKIGEGVIQTAHIEDAAITQAKIGSAAVGSANIQNAAIGSAQIADAAITNAKVGGAAIGTANMQDASISTVKIADGAITRAKIAELAVGSAEIDDLAVTTAKIALAAITNAQIGNAAVDTAQIALGAITSALISAGAVGTAQIADASITDAKVVSLNADVITSGTLATERLIIKGANGLIYELNAEAGALTAQQLTETKYKNALDGSVLVAKSVTADQIAAATITANEILSGTITGDKIAAATIEGSNIKAGAITTSHVSSDFGSTLDLSSNTGINMRVEQINSDIDEVRSAAVAEVLVQYALSNSASSAPSSGWQTNAPAWQDGKFMWQRTVTTYADGETETSDATCLTGATGAAGEAATTLRIESSRGTVFKRDDISTVLSAVIYRGSQRITNITELRSTFGQTAYLQWKWRRRDDTGYGVISASDTRITDSGFSFTITADDVDSNVSFMCELITD